MLCLTRCCPCYGSNTCRDSAVPGLSLGTVRLLPSISPSNGTHLPSLIMSTWTLSSASISHVLLLLSLTGRARWVLYLQVGLPCSFQTCWDIWLHQQPAFSRTMMFALRADPGPVQECTSILAGTSWAAALSAHVAVWQGRETYSSTGMPWLSWSPNKAFRLQLPFLPSTGPSTRAGTPKGPPVMDTPMSTPMADVHQRYNTRKCLPAPGVMPMAGGCHNSLEFSLLGVLCRGSSSAGWNALEEAKEATLRSLLAAPLCKYDSFSWLQLCSTLDHL